MRYLYSLLAIMAVLCACTRNRNDRGGIVIREASGIARIGNKLFIVGDDADGKYFEIGLKEREGPIIPIDPRKVREVNMPHAEVARDLEGIDDLADGRMAILSEQLHCLIARESLESPYYTIIAEYDKSLTEFGHRGLEGLAVKKLVNNKSRIAVLWEGGYPILHDVPLELQKRMDHFALKPVVVVHDIQDGGIAEDVFYPLHHFLLNVPKPDGEEPLAQRFRATALVWHQLDDGEEGFIVLLSSENAPPQNSGVSREYKIKILQRFDLQGDPVGNPLSINEMGREAFKKIGNEILEGLSPQMTQHIKNITSLLNEGNWENINWEGLDWFEEGKSLITIYDKKPIDPPFALIIELPEEWH